MLRALSSKLFDTKNQNTDRRVATEIIPKDLWFEILVRVDDKTLLSSCTLVCGDLNEILKTQAFWLEKCFRAKIVIPPKVHSHRVNYRNIYFGQPFGRNLIKNSSGENQLEFWSIVENGGDKFCVEHPPKGSDVDGFPLCFATSYGNCVKQQLIDLEKIGCEGWLLDELKPTISISEWHAARFDCASTYRMHVMLLRRYTDNYDHRRNAPWNNGMGASDANRKFYTQPAENIVVEFFQPTYIEQWVGKAWQETFHEFRNYPEGVRYVLFQSSGIDNQFWAGHFGSKMAKASVVLSFDIH